ncbi:MULTISPECIES: hypothetical protein [Alphaproteobacteria]|uniref:hypothetical protein n=1 Tax=Alphaproteobacteria TaxID=28211 RepID=UPI003265E5DF
MRLTVGSRNIADTRIQGVTLRPLVGCFELIFGIYVTIHADESALREASITGARVTLTPSSGRTESLGFARPEGPFEIACKASVSTMTPGLHLILQPTQIAAIEALRGTGDLTFELLAVGTGIDEQGRHPVQDDWRVTVPRSDWINELRRAGARNVLLLEVPLPVGDMPEGWKDIAEGLQRAEDQYRNSDYHSCIGSCRTVIQELGYYRYQSEEWAGEPLGRIASDRKGMTKGEREAALWAVLRHYTHQAHHGPSEGGVPDYSRAEAHFILTLTAAAVAHAQTVS